MFILLAFLFTKCNSHPYPSS